MKIIKRIFLGLFILLFLIIASVFVLITFYKKEMAQLLTDNLKAGYGLTLKIEDADVSFFSNWPQASVKLKNIYLASDRYPNPNEPFLKAGSISLSFNLKKLLHKQFVVRSVSISDAEILLVKNTDGSRNFEVRQSPAAAHHDSSTISFEVDKVTIKNTRFRFINHDKNQNIDLHLVDEHIRLKQAQDGLWARMEGDLKITELLFNPKNGPFLKNTSVKTSLSLAAYFKSKMIVVYPSSSVSIQNHPYRVSSFITLADTGSLMLQIKSENIRYEEASRLLTPKIQKALGNFSVEKPFNATALIITALRVKQDPILLVNIDVTNNNIKIGHSKIPYSNVSFKGRVFSLDSSRRKGNMEEASISFTGIKGKIYDYPFSASVLLRNLTDPDIAINGRLQIEASKIKYKVAQDFILKGSCVVQLRYSGPANRLNKEQFLSPAMRLDANLLFNNFSYQEANKPFTYVVNGKARVNNRDLTFENLLLRTEGGEAALKGRAENFVNYVLGYSNTVKADLSARTDYFNLNPFLPKKGEAAAKKANESPADAHKQSAKKVDESQFEFNASLFAKKLYIRKVEAENASIVLSHKNRLLTIKSINAHTCGGKLEAKGSIYDLSRVNVEMQMDDIDISQLFDEFENFGQKKVESRHVKGRIFLNATFKTDLDDNMEVKGESMAGEVKLKLKDGHLQNFEPVQNMSNIIFRNRNFDDVTFSELNETFKIKGFEMQIEELEIGSNLLNLYVKGIYHFKESSNINVTIPWHNLRKRGKNYVPKNYGEGENAKGLKLNFSGPTNNMKLSFGHKELSK